MSQEKPGLSNEEGKPTPGQIGLVDGDKLVEWILENYQKPLGLNSSTAGMVMVKLEIQSGRFSVSGQGQEERDYTPEQILLEKLQELKVELAFQHGNSLHECKACSLLREITGDDGTMEGISGKLISIASADKAEAERKDSE